MNDDYESRRGLTFAQAEGAEELPRQLELGEVSKALRAKLLRVLLDSLETSKGYSSAGGVYPWVKDPWLPVLRDHFVDFLDGFVDEFPTKFQPHADAISKMVRDSNYVGLFGSLQFFLQHPRCPHGLNRSIESVLRLSRAAYRVVDGGLIVPIASEEEAKTFATALQALERQGADGARQHLVLAASKLTEGDWAGSVRESIHAVEAVARRLAPSEKTLGPALDRLARDGHVHQALRAGMTKLYGYTSSEPGIRHPLLDQGEAQVDEIDAMYMLGACAAFVTYLSRRAEATGLIG